MCEVNKTDTVYSRLRNLSPKAKLSNERSSLRLAKKEMKSYKDSNNHIKTLDKSHSAVKKYLTLIFDKPILNIHLHTQISKRNFEVEWKNNFSKKKVGLSY